MAKEHLNSLKNEEETQKEIVYATKDDTLQAEHLKDCKETFIWYLEKMIQQEFDTATTTDKPYEEIQKSYHRTQAFRNAINNLDHIIKKYTDVSE